MRLLFAALSLLILSACGANTVKIYKLDPSQGLVRTQDKEVKPFIDAGGYLCESPNDFADTVSCTATDAKVYELDPSHGLKREQSNEPPLTFEQASGFLCTSPRDFEFILNKCAKEGYGDK